MSASQCGVGRRGLDVHREEEEECTISPRSVPYIHASVQFIHHPIPAYYLLWPRSATRQPAGVGGRRVPWRAPGVVLVDVLRATSRCEPVHGAVHWIVDGRLEAKTAQVGLHSTACVVALRAPNEAALGVPDTTSPPPQHIHMRACQTCKRRAR